MSLLHGVFRGLGEREMLLFQYTDSYCSIKETRPKPSEVLSLTFKVISKAFRPSTFPRLEASVILCGATSSTGCATGRAAISRSQAIGLTAGPDCLSQSFVQICAFNLSVLHEENHCGFYAEAVPLS